MPEAVPIPDELADPEVIRNRGQWAEKFPGTNMAQRARHNKDTLAYTQQLQDERALREMERVKTDRVAQAAYFREKEFRVKQQTAAQLMDHRAEMHDATLELREVQTRTTIARERALATAAKAKEELTQRAADDTTLFSKRVTEAIKKHRPGTPEYTRAVAEARLAAPATDKVVFDDIWKSTNSDLPPEQVIENFKKVQSLASTATVSATATGGTTITQRPGAESAPLERERGIYLGLREKAKARLAKEDDPAKQAIHKADLDEYEQKLSETTSNLEAARKPAVPSAPAATASPDITRDEYEKLPAGATFWHGGRQLTKK